METNQVPWSERISYGLTDTGYNLVFTMVGTYLLFFYTDVYGVAAAVIAPLFLLARVLDGVTDPFEGIIIDKIHTRWGKCRPFWLWFSTPFAVLAVLTFSAPDFSATGKIIYVYATYIGLNLFISLVSLPISAILPNLTNNNHERTVVNVVRMVCNAVGSLIVAAATIPLVAAFGRGNSQQGFFLTAVLFAFVAVVLFINGWAHTRERVQPNNGKPVSVKDGIRSINTLPWYLLLALVVIVNLSLTIKNQSTIYYMQYNLNRPDLTPALLTLPNLFLLLAIVVSPTISKRMGKRNASLLGVFISIAGNILIVVANSSIPLLFAGTIISFLGLGIPAGLLGAMFADTVDYAEWKTGVRSTGIIYSASSFGVKMGQGLGGALGAMIMALGHYVPNAVQSVSALAAIRFNFVWSVLIAVIILAVLFYFYPVDKLYPQIQADLEMRRL